jgi:bifunctional UDP-N-acetylglucosamine pyrophosphorylase/glucosamine-1-phosphate N-acetyltransferase
MGKAAMILAAGKGTRMKSDLPKVLHEIDGRPMVSYVVDVVRPLCDAIYIIVGYEADRVRDALADQPGLEFVLQEEQLGTGHAVMQGEDGLAGFAGTLMVLNGDVPGLRRETIERFMAEHDRAGAAATVLTAELEDPMGYGRIVRSDDGGLLAIVEQKDADEATRAIREINSGLFCFDKVKLFDALKRTSQENAQKEYYLTDVIDVMRRDGEVVGAFCVSDPREVAGVNTVEELEGLRNFMKE